VIVLNVVSQGNLRELLVNTMHCTISTNVRFFVFGHSILLGSPWLGELMSNAIFFIEFFKIL